MARTIKGRRVTQLLLLVLLALSFKGFTLSCEGTALLGSGTISIPISVGSHFAIWRRRSEESGEAPSPLFLKVLILKVGEVVCFHTDLKVCDSEGVRRRGRAGIGANPREQNFLINN